MTPFDLLAVAVTILLTALLLCLEHWWTYCIRQKPPEQPWSYVLGSATVQLCFTTWGLLTGNLLAVAVLFLTYAVGGVIVIGMHLMERARDGEGYKQTAEQLTLALRQDDGKE